MNSKDYLDLLDILNENMEKENMVNELMDDITY